VRFKGNKKHTGIQRDLVSAFWSCCAGEIKRLGGMVAKYLGDGVLGRSLRSAC